MRKYMTLTTNYGTSQKCEKDGCPLFAEYINPRGNKLCSDCIQGDVETCEYTWDEVEVLRN